MFQRIGIKNFWKSSKDMRKRVVRTAIVTLLSLSGIWVLFYFAGRMFCGEVIDRLSDLTKTRISAEEVKFNPDGSLTIRQMKISQGREQGRQETILEAAKVRIKFKWYSFLLLRPVPRKISCENFIFNVQYDADGRRWNLPALKTGEGKFVFGDIPEIVIKGGIFRYGTITEGQSAVRAKIPFSALLISSKRIKKKDKVWADLIKKWGTAAADKDKLVFDISTDEWGSFGRLTGKGVFEEGLIKIEGAISDGRGTDKEVLTAERLDAELTYDGEGGYNLKLAAKALDGGKRSYDEHAAILSALGEETVGAFATMRKFLDRYRPAGSIDANMSIFGNLRNIRESKISGKAYCRSVDIYARKFEYPVDGLKGWIDFTENKAVLHDLRGTHKDVELNIDGWTEKRAEETLYSINITSDNLLLDDDLYKALNDKQKRFWDEFSPRGKAAVKLTMDNGSGKEAENTLAVRLCETGAKWKRLDYPLENLTGDLIIDDNKIIISDVVSRRGGEKIVINGKIAREKGERQAEYDIAVNGEKVEAGFINGQGFREKIKDIIPTVYTGVTEKLNAEGLIDFNVIYKRGGGDSRPDYNIEAELLGDKIEYEGFPYSFKDVRGRIKATNNSLRFLSVSGNIADSVERQENSRVEISGEITTAGNNLRGANFHLEANDIILDERFGRMLPKETADLYFKGDARGKLNLDFEDISFFTAAGGERYVEFKGRLEPRGCDFNVTPKISELKGEILLEGLYSDANGLCAGKAAVRGGSFRVSDKQFTDCSADFIYNNDANKWESTNLFATCYNGKVAGKIQMEDGGRQGWAYLVDAGFEDIDLSRFLSKEVVDSNKPEKGGQEGRSNAEYTGGKIYGTLGIYGRITGRQNRIGRCRLEITDMRAGKVSVIGKILYILRLNEPRDYAFDKMTVDSYIENNRLLIPKIDLAGPALAFNGSGEEELNSENVNIILTARGSRLAGKGPSALQRLTEGLGQGIVQLQVAGPLENPEVKILPLPIIKETLGLLGTKGKK